MVLLSRKGRSLCFCGEPNAGKKTNRQEKEVMQVLDLLHAHDDDDDDMETNNNSRKGDSTTISLPPPSSSTTTTNSPRSLLSRWFFSLHKPPSPSPDGGGGGVEVGFGPGCLVRFPRHVKKRRRKKKNEEQGRGNEVGPFPLESEMEGIGENDVPPPESVSLEEGRVGSEGSGVGGLSSSYLPFQGRKPEDVSFNLGMGVGLVFLLTRSATEFNKMIELRTQMEMLLKDIKDEMRRKDVISSFSGSNNNLAIFASDSCGNENTVKPIFLQNRRSSFPFVETHCAMEYDRQSKCGATFGNKSSLKMDQLEAELEVELERLQLNLEGEGSSVNPGPHRMELTSESSDPFDSFSISFGEGNGPREEEEDNSEQCGVSARELERRLHELLETRQQERIAELESALACAERKLREKETEICWWRDTAKLVSQHKDELMFR